MTPRETLKKYFGYDTFRSPQAEIIKAVLEHQSVVAILPTGTGKSLCFQIPALLLPKITLVISPLIALMEDQVNHLNEAKIPATFINSSLSKEEREKREKGILENEYKLVYSTPERLKQNKFIQLLNNAGVSLVVIDEAHCISEWGHDFRPEYRKIVKNISKLSTKPKIAAFTATATKETLQDILRVLNLDEPEVFSISPLRTNLSLNVIPCNTAAEQEIHLLRILDKFQNQSGIIYCATRRKVEELKQFIDFYKPKLSTFTEYYHGGMETEARALVQANFASDKTKIIAFLGRIQFIKGIDYILKVLPKIKTNHKVIFLIIGPDEGEKIKLIAQAKNLQIDKKILFVGQLNGKEKLETIKSCDLFLLLSRSEGLPISVLEIAALGIPQIVSKQCNMPEIEKYHAGYIVNKNNSFLIAQKIAMILSDKNEWHTLSTNAKIMCKEKFSFDNIVSTYEKMLSKIYHEKFN